MICQIPSNSWKLSTLLFQNPAIMSKWNFFSVIFLITILYACKNGESEPQVLDSYASSMDAYWTERQEGRTTYLQLTALHPLRDSVMTFGTSNENDLVIQSDGLAEIIGKYTIANDSIYFESTDTVKVTDGKDEIISNLKFAQADVADSPKLHHNHLNWMVILRSGGLYLRVWDENNPFVDSFKGFERFDLSTKSIYEGTFSLISLDGSRTHYPVVSFPFSEYRGGKDGPSRIETYRNTEDFVCSS